MAEAREWAAKAPHPLVGRDGRADVAEDRQGGITIGEDTGG